MATATKTPAKKSVKTKAVKKKATASTAKKVTASKAKAKTSVKTPAKKGAAKELIDLFEDGLKDLYWAEKALSKELPKMQKNATSSKLKTAIEKHTKETEDQIKRLEGCFKALGKKAQAKKCDAMAGLLEEGKSIVKETKVGPVRDAGIILASQKIEHYEIASYGTLAAFAKVLKQDKCLKLLLETLKEEKKCDETLTSIADTDLNTSAL